jgi:hypothetical protein
MVSITVDEEIIKTKAYELSQEPKSHDDLVWLFAEAELRLKPAYLIGKLYDESKVVNIDADLLVDQPSEDEIRVYADELAKQNPADQDLHWYIAERNYVFEQAKLG